MVCESVNYPTKTPPLIFRDETPPPIYSINIKIPAMNKSIKMVLVVVLILCVFYSSMMLYIFNTTSLPSNVCSDCIPMNKEELKFYNVCKCILIIGTLVLTTIYIKYINPKQTNN